LRADLFVALFWGVRHSLVCTSGEWGESCLYLFMVAHEARQDERMKRNFGHFRVKLHWYRLDGRSFPIEG
jgi:hypothetical protein